VEFHPFYIFSIIFYEITQKEEQLETAKQQVIPGGE